MGDSSDSEEFYDAEEFTPIKGSKRSSMIQLSSGSSESLSKDRTPKIPDNPSLLTEAPHPSSTNIVAPVDDKHAVENVVQGRKRFQELRRHMQTEEEDDGTDIVEQARHSYTQEHPFKIIAHDTMSLQSMTSLGRIGRLLSGASESHSNLRETMTASSNATSREPSTISDDALAGDSRNQTVLAMSEPDVIASTKANSLRSRPAAPVSAGAGAGAGAGAAGSPPARDPRPAPPPRPPRRKRKKLYGSQSLSTTDGDNLSLCTVNTDDMNYTFRPTTKPLLVEAPSAQLSSHSMSLPSPASTIESLTRQFQDSLELEHSRYASDLSGLDDTVHKVEATPQTSDYSKGDYTTKLEDDRIERGTGSRTHSESRANVSAASHNRRRRVSCGDEQQTRDKLTDQEILAQVTVLNLDTGERLPLSIAEHKLPQCINPLSLQIMRLTSEYYGRENDENVSPDHKARSWRKRLSLTMNLASYQILRGSQSGTLTADSSAVTLQNRDTDEESESVCASGIDDDAKETKQEALDKTTAIRRKTEKLKRFFGSTVKKTVDAAKSLAQEVSHARHKEDVGEIPDDVRGESIKLKASNSHKGPYDFDGCVRHVQEMDGAHVGAVWCCRWSECGRLLATCGQDRRLRLWCTRDAFPALQEMRAKYNAEQKSSPTPSQESLCSLGGFANTARGTGVGGGTSTPLNASAVFCETPFAVYSGHTSDLLDVSWSKNNFILSSSMDKTVRLWHISRLECLCCFQHIDFVTAIVFHPRDDRYFLSGSLDGKLRLWNIPDKKVAVWNEVDGKTKLITAANFCQNGKFAVVGTYDGRCIFYTTDQLKYHTQIDVRSTRGKNSTGRKISGIEPMPNDDKILITSNDSRIRLYDLRDLNLSCKYKGYVNVSSQIKASFSHDGKYIVSGSENQCIYIWKTHHDYSKFTSVRRDRNDFWEGIKAHNAVVTCSVFAPNPDYIIRMIEERERMEKMANKEFDDKAEEEAKTAEGGMVSSSQTGHVLVSADFNGCIKVFVHKAKPKHSSLPASALA